MQSIGRLLGAYLFPVLLIVFGLMLLIVSSGQTNLFKIAGLGILIVGILGALYVKGVVSRQIQMIVYGCCCCQGAGILCRKWIIKSSKMN